MKEKLDLKGKHINYNLNESKNRPECIYTVYLMLRKKYTYDFSSNSNRLPCGISKFFLYSCTEW